MGTRLTHNAQPHVVTNPDWASRPSGEDVARFYPPDAARHDIEGAATVACQVTRDGALRDCRIQSETPAGAGFGRAAADLAQTRFKMRPMTVDGQPVDGGIVRIPIRFVLPPPPRREAPRTHPDPSPEAPGVLIAAVVVLAIVAAVAIRWGGMARDALPFLPRRKAANSAPEPPSGRFAEVYRAFDNRFEEDRGGYILRSKPGAPGFRVSASERDEMVADFRRGTRWLTWGGAGVMIALFAGVFLLFDSQGREPPTWAIWVVVLLGGGLIAGGMMWLSYAPFRRIEGRMQIQGQPRDLARRTALDRITWGQLGVGFFSVPFMLFQAGRLGDLRVGWNRLWLVAAAVLLVGLTIQAWRKWRYGSRD